MNLLETQRKSKLNIDPLKINITDIVLVFYEKVPKHFWKIFIVTWVLTSRDSEIREVIVRIAKTNTVHKNPVNKLFTVENTYHDTNQTDKASNKEIASPSLLPSESRISWKQIKIEKKPILLDNIYEQTFRVWWVKSILVLSHLYIFIEIYSLILTK